MKKKNVSIFFGLSKLHWSLIIVSLAMCAVLFSLILLADPFEQQVVAVHLRVSDYVGFNLDTEKLYLGTTMPGGRSSRGITVQSSKDAYVVITAQGPLSGWLSTPEDSFLLVANTPKHVVFNAHPPANTVHGNYTGQVTFSFYHPLARLLFSP